MWQNYKEKKGIINKMQDRGLLGRQGHMQSTSSKMLVIPKP